MEATVVPGDDSQAEGTILTTLDVEDDFESVYDVPFVTVNRIGGEYLAEVVFSGDPMVDGDRVRTALAVGRDHGVCSFARVFGEDCVTIHFTDDPAKGLIWGLEEEIGNSWLQ